MNPVLKQNATAVSTNNSATEGTEKSNPQDALWQIEEKISVPTILNLTGKLIDSGKNFYMRGSALLGGLLATRGVLPVYL